MIIARSLMLAASEGPKPYPRALHCAGLTMAWSDLETENRSAGASLARSNAEFWRLATMDAARRAGSLKAPEVETATTEVTQTARTRFQVRDDSAARDLLGCQMMVPQKGRAIDPIGN